MNVSFKHASSHEVQISDNLTNPVLQAARPLKEDAPEFQVEAMTVCTESMFKLA
jgi:hypothetical protein